MHLHEELRSAREQAGFSQAHLAALAGIPRNQIVRAEKGDNLTIDTLRKIAAHLPVTELTLLETVKLKTDFIPAHEKLYLGVMETLAQMLGALATALNTADIARAAAAAVRRQQDLDEPADVDPRMLFQRIETPLKAVEHDLKRTA